MLTLKRILINQLVPNCWLILRKTKYKILIFQPSIKDLHFVSESTNDVTGTERVKSTNCTLKHDLGLKVGVTLFIVHCLLSLKVVKIDLKISISLL